MFCGLIYTDANPKSKLSTQSYRLTLSPSIHFLYSHVLAMVTRLALKFLSLLSPNSVKIWRWVTLSLTCLHSSKMKLVHELDQCWCSALSRSQIGMMYARLRFGSTATGSMTYQGSQGGLVQRRVALQGHAAAGGETEKLLRCWFLPPAATIKQFLFGFFPSSSSRDLFEFCRFPVRSSRVSSKTKPSSRHNDHYFVVSFWSSLRSTVESVNGEPVTLSKLLRERWQLFWKEDFPLKRSKAPPPDSGHRLHPVLIRCAPSCGKSQTKYTSRCLLLQQLIITITTGSLNWKDWYPSHLVIFISSR